MSDPSASPPQTPPATPATTKQAPGVRSARQSPAQNITLQTGDVIGGKFIVGRYLGSSTGTVSYLCKDSKRDRDTVIKVFDVSIMPAPVQEQLNQDVPKAAKLSHRNITSLYGMGQVDASQIFVAMEYIKGPSLARLIAQRREAGHRSNLRDVFTIIAHLTHTLERIHAAGMSHGVVTPYNLSLSRRGTLKLSNLVFGWALAAALAPREEGPFHDSIYVAPEVVRDPMALNAASDVYSVAMLTVEMLSERGLPNNRAGARSAVAGVLSEYPPKLTQLLLRALSQDPSQRPDSPAVIREILLETARAEGVRLGHPPEEGELPVEPAVEPEESSEAEEEDLFDIPGPEAASDHGSAFGDFVFEEEDEEEGRFLIQKDGLDYGPFTEEQVLEQLRADEIDESTQILDRITQQRTRLDASPAFEVAVAEYIPVREERRRKEAEARAELQRKVKKGGVAVFVVGIAAGLVVLAGMIYVVATQPEPKPLPMDRAFASLDYKLLPPPKEFTTVAVADDVMQSIFNPKASDAEIAKQLKRYNKKRGKRRAKKPTQGKNAGVGDNVTEVNMAGGAGSNKILSDGDVNEVILGKGGTLRRCVMKEFQSNPDFKGVTVQFFIRPSGTTGGVKIKEAQYASKPVGRCLVSRFRAMKFPEHGGFNKGVVFPLKVQ